MKVKILSSILFVLILLSIIVVKPTQANPTVLPTPSVPRKVFIPVIQKSPATPIFIGLKIRYDGSGFIRGTSYKDVGTHNTIVFDQMIDADTIRCLWKYWYDPNPNNWSVTNSNDYYSVSTGKFISTSYINDPSFKWGYSTFRSYNSLWVSGSTILVGGQKFTATGPIDGYTSFGKPIKYWQLVNQDKFLYWDGGGDWKQYIHPGEAILRYDDGFSRLLLYSNVLRRYYYKDSQNSETVQYIEILSSATSIPGSPMFVPDENVEPLFYTSGDQMGNGLKK